MAKEKKYTYKITLRLSAEGGEGLEAKAAVMGLTPAVAGRVIIEHSVSGKPIKKGGSNGAIQQKK